MRYLVHVSDQCRSEARKHGHSGTLDSLAQKIIDDQKISWHYYKAPWFIRKKIGSDYRLVAKQVPMQKLDATVICFLSFFSKGDYERDNFDVETVVLPSDKELSTYVQSKLDSGDLPDPNEPPDDAESAFLNSTHSDHDPLDIIVYESHEWAKAMEEQWARESFDSIHSLVETVAWTEAEAADTEILDNSRVKIAFRKFANPRSLLLLGVMRSNDSHVGLVEKYAALRPETIQNEDLVRQYSRKAYPRIITADIEVWKLVEKDESANLALSSEETRVLDSVSATGDKVYPLFINGRPGSGKSTILHYLFTNLLSAHIETDPNERTEFPPLYLTYSRKLLDVSIANIRSILRLNANRLAKGVSVDKTELEFERIRETCFGEFHRFLKGLLSEEQAHRFAPDTRIDFPRFRREFQKIKWKRKELNRLSPEVAWHVIRSYIKGMCDENGDYFDQDDYRRFDTKRKTVTQDTFDTVFKHAWEGWYRGFANDHGHWDNQDLTRSILDSDTNIARYPVVFCDEAQDFTPNELEVILRLSLFSSRKLQPFQLKHVPFAFAGDPFQTLNPTGFDWEKMQSTFHEKVIQELDGTNSSGLEFNYQELRFNYRSTKDIAGVCNLIQLVRGIVFDKKGIEPQESWKRNVSGTRVPSYFSTSNTDAKRQVSEQKDLVIVLPCQDGEEEAYIEGDPFLKQLRDSGGNINMLSSMGAKGQEFSRVVIYKFGDECLTATPGFAKELQGDSANGVSGDLEKKLGWEYFLNRLYVAASRPKRDLYILDTDDGIEKVWKSPLLTKPEDLIERYQRQSVDSSKWTSEHVTLPVPGTEISPSDRTTDDLLSLAEQFREEGRTTKSPYLLKLAASNFRHLDGREFDARLCDAERFQLEDKPQDAADAYLAVNKTSEALKCLWDAELYDRIASEDRFVDRSERQISLFLNSEADLDACRSISQFLRGEVTGVDRVRITTDSAWQTAFWKVVESMLKLSISSEDSRRLFLEVKNVSDNWPGLGVRRELADLAFRGGEYADVVSIFDGLPADFQSEKEYLIAAYETEKGERPTPDYLRRVFAANLALGRFREACRVAESVSFEDQWLDLLQRVPNDPQYQDISVKAACGLIIHYLRRSDSTKIKDIVGDKRWRPDDKEDILRTVLYADELYSLTDKDLQFKLVEQSVTVVRELTTSDVDRIDAAIGPLGRIVDSLKLAEVVMAKQNIESEPLEAIRRVWLRTKLRQRDQAVSAGRTRDVGRYETEFVDRANEWCLPDILSEFEPFNPRPAEKADSPLSPEQKSAASALEKLGKSEDEIATIIVATPEHVSEFLSNAARRQDAAK